MSKTFLLFENKKNIRKYIICDSYQCGLVLTSQSLKDVLRRQISLASCHGWIKETELFLRQFGTYEVKLLLHKQEIRRIIRLVNEKKYLMIPTKVYLKNHKVKVEVALCKLNTEIRDKEKLHKLREKSWAKFNSDEGY